MLAHSQWVIPLKYHPFSKILSIYGDLDMHVWGLLIIHMCVSPWTSADPPCSEFSSS